MRHKGIDPGARANDKDHTEDVAKVPHTRVLSQQSEEARSARNFNVLLTIAAQRRRLNLMIIHGIGEESAVDDGEAKTGDVTAQMEGAEHEDIVVEVEAERREGVVLSDLGSDVEDADRHGAFIKYEGEAALDGAAEEYDTGDEVPDRADARHHDPVDSDQNG